MRKNRKNTWKYDSDTTSPIVKKNWSRICTHCDVSVHWMVIASIDSITCTNVSNISNHLSR